MEIDRNGLEVLSREECLRLLRHATLGRVAITSGALPQVLPVNFRLVGDRIVFRTGLGTKFDAATSNNVVAFEVDEMDALSHSGWSVMVTGIVHEVTDPQELAELTHVGIPKWAPTSSDRIVAISTEVISGRRMGTAPSPVFG
jgi:nitroimidazol reductase NimA-like FMN-containing flavoprotein (pyridoxamine 5'-phosphate oxidase superfamily)